MVSYLCEFMVYLVLVTITISQKNLHQKRTARELADEEVKEIILKAYHFRVRKKGARQIKMTLENHYELLIT